MRDGCYSNVEGFFISRQEMPKECDENRCPRKHQCFRLSFKKQTGVEAVPGFSYKVVTPKWRATSE